MHNRYFTDEELTAFLDGEDDHAPIVEIKSALNSNSALVQRVEALRINIKAIIEGFQSLAPDESGSRCSVLRKPVTVDSRPYALPCAIAQRCP